MERYKVVKAKTKKQIRQNRKEKKDNLQMKENPNYMHDNKKSKLRK